MKGFKVKVKSQKVMGDYRCLHGLVPNNELPKRLRGKIPKNEIWMRRDQYNNNDKRQAILDHEGDELHLMTKKKMTYKKAHRRAQITENTWRFRKFKRYLKKVRI